LRSQARRAGGVQERGRGLVDRDRGPGLPLRLQLLLALAPLARLAGGGRGRGRRRRLVALLALGGDARGQRLLLLLALRLVLLAAVDPPLTRREGVDHERALELVRRVLVHRAGRRLGVHAQLLEAIDHLLARKAQIPR